MVIGGLDARLPVKQYIQVPPKYLHNAGAEQRSLTTALMYTCQIFVMIFYFYFRTHT